MALGKRVTWGRDIWCNWEISILTSCSSMLVLSFEALHLLASLVWPFKLQQSHSSLLRQAVLTCLWQQQWEHIGSAGFWFIIWSLPRVLVPPFFFLMICWDINVPTRTFALWRSVDCVILFSNAWLSSRTASSLLPWSFSQRALVCCRCSRPWWPKLSV